MRVVPPAGPHQVATALSLAIRRRRDDFIAAAVADLGFRIADATSELDGTIAFIDRWLAEEVTALTLGRLPCCGPGQQAFLLLPSNASVSTAADVARAAIPGNPVRARLSSRATTIVQLLQETFDEVLPGAVTMERSMSGPEFLSEGLESPDVAFLMAWGGETLGDELLRRARRSSGRKVVFEGPGKDPAILLPGTDVGRAAEQLRWAKFALSGQSCTAPENIIVHRAHYDELATLLVDACEKIRVGDPSDPNTELGPTISCKVPQIVRQQLTDAIDQGASIVTGGRVEGQFIYPTVVTGVTPQMKLFQDETFAPVFAILVFDDEEEALALARNTRFGLRVSATGTRAAAILAQLRGDDYAEPVDDLTYGRFGMSAVDQLADSEYPVPFAFGGYGKSGWVWDGLRLHQGPKAIPREATVARPA